MNPFIAALGALIVAVSVGSPMAQARPNRAALERELAQARARWIDRRPANYEFVLNVPTNESPWQRRFGIFRVMGNSASAIVPLTGSRATSFQDRTTIDALFELVANRIDASPADTSPSYDLDLGYVTSLFSPDSQAPAFQIPVWRPFKEVVDVREPFALVQHVNHCGAVGMNRTDLHVCPDYAVAIWGDGTVVYNGRAGVRTLDRRQHQVGEDAVRDLARAISDSKFFEAADAYGGVSTGGDRWITVDHAPEQWITIRAGGRSKTILDFYGAPESIKTLEASIERAADSRRYTGRAEGPERRVRK